MELPMSRASAFLKRNRTTHSWYGDWSSAGCIMSQSCPSARTLEEHMRNARKAMSVSSSFYQPRATFPATPPATPVPSASNLASSSSPSKGSGFAVKPRCLVVGGAGRRGGGGGVAIRRDLQHFNASAVPSSSASSPGPTTTTNAAAINIPNGPELHNASSSSSGALVVLDDPDGSGANSYSYDGGFFVTANNSAKDFFVIDPEWVSEEEAMKNLPGRDLQEGEGGSKKAGGGGGGRGKKGVSPPKVLGSKAYYKRSKSAPPSNHRVNSHTNPITWQL